MANPRTVAEVEAALIHATRVIGRCTSHPGPKRLRATHPEIVRDYADALAAEPMRDPARWAWSPSRIPPGGDAIDAAQATIGWLQLIENATHRQAVALWIACRAASHGSRSGYWHHARPLFRGVTRDTAYDWKNKGLAALVAALRLPAKKAIKFQRKLASAS